MSKFSPKPWRVEYDETPFEADLVDANGHRVPGIRLYLDDADLAGNYLRSHNHREVVQAVNTRDEREALIRELVAVVYEVHRVLTAPSRRL